MIISCFVLLSALAGASAAATSDMRNLPGGTICPLCVSSAYDEGRGNEYENATVNALLSLQKMETDDLDAVVSDVVVLVTERGVQGLEPLLISALDELGSRGMRGYALAHDRQKELAVSYWVDEELVRTNAIAPVYRAGDPVIRHIQVQVLNTALQNQLIGGELDLEVGLQEALCTEEGIENFGERYGSALAGHLQGLCEGSGAGGGGGHIIGGGVGMGSITTGLSVFDCMSSHQPTRAERVQRAMTDCLDSQEGGVGGNPLMSGSTFDRVFPLRDPAYNQEVRDPVTGEVTSRVHYDSADEPIVADDYHEDGSFTRNYYNDAGETALEIEYDDDGNMVEGKAFEEGRLVESVENHEDGSYTVKRYDEEGSVTHEQTYNEDGEPVDSSSGNATPDNMDGEWGDTDECRELNLLLLGERLDLNRDEYGLRPEVVNPNPDIAPMPSEMETDCLGSLLLTGGTMNTWRSMECNQLVNCLVGHTLDENCNCVQQNLGLSLPRQCMVRIVCANGVEPVEIDGQCTCVGEEPVLEEDMFPRPTPVMRRGVLRGFD